MATQLFFIQDGIIIFMKIWVLSCHSLRQRRTRLTPIYVKFFLEATNELDIKNKISTDIDQIYNQLISDGIVTNR